MATSGTSIRSMPAGSLPPCKTWRGFALARLFATSWRSSRADRFDLHVPGRPGGRVMKEYTVIYERGRRNWSAYVPDLPGCIATAKTRRRLERLIREAVEFHIEGLRRHGEPVPPPTVEAGTVSVAEE